MDRRAALRFGFWTGVAVAAPEVVACAPGTQSAKDQPVTETPVTPETPAMKQLLTDFQALAKAEQIPGKISLQTISKGEVQPDGGRQVHGHYLVIDTGDSIDDAKAVLSILDRAEDLRRKTTGGEGGAMLPEQLRRAAQDTELQLRREPALTYPSPKPNNLVHVAIKGRFEEVVPGAGGKKSTPEIFLIDRSYSPYANNLSPQRLAFSTGSSVAYTDRLSRQGGSLIINAAVRMAPRR